MTTSTNSHSHYRIRWIGVIAAVVLILGAVIEARAEQVRIFTGAPPSADELANMMFPERAAPPKVRTRSIVFVNQTPAAAAVKVASKKPSKTASKSRKASKKQQQASTQKTQARPRQDAEGFGFPINFAFNSIQVLPESRTYLDKVGEMLRLPAVADKSIVIEGHTDAIGTAQYNKQLSEQRALAIKQYLIEQYEIAPKRLIVVGKGESDPLPGQSPSDGINRRVQFHRAVN